MTDVPVGERGRAPGPRREVAAPESGGGRAHPRLAHPRNRGHPQHAPLMVERLELNVMRGGDVDRGLEAGLRNGTHQVEAGRPGSAEDSPERDGGGAVPAHVHSGGPSGCRCHDRRGDGRRSGPLESVRAVAGGVGDKAAIEYGPPAAVELREVRLLAPADERVGSRQRLEVALEVRDQRWGVDVLERQLGGLVLEVQYEHEPARLRMDIGETTTVVEQGHHAVARCVYLDVMLELKSVPLFDS